LRTLTTTPSAENFRSYTWIPASSERRNPPANPPRTIAESRSPITSSRRAATIRRTSAQRSGSFPRCAVPIVRRIPLRVSPTTKWRDVAGEFAKTAAWCALVIEVRRRLIVPEPMWRRGRRCREQRSQASRAATATDDYGTRTRSRASRFCKPSVWRGPWLRQRRSSLSGSAPRCLASEGPESMYKAAWTSFR